MRGEFRVIRVEDVGSRRSDGPFPREPLRNPELAWLFERSFSDPHAEKLETQERLFDLIASLLALGVTGAPYRTRGGRGVGRARELLHARFDQSVTLDELAQAAGMEKFGCCAHFHSSLALALAVGYSEQSVLQRPFRQLIGVTPGAYARALR